jgi:TRAP transporter TAXI family solute receptor
MESNVPPSSSDDLDTQSRHDKWRFAALILALIAVSVWFSLQYLQPAVPRHIVLASGADFGLYHRYAQRYIQELARDGVVVEERMTGGAADNLRLLRDPHSGVDVAFLQGGIANSAEAEDVQMLASLYYEPLWLFYRDAKPWILINEIRGKRIAVGALGSGTRAFVEPLLAFNAILRSNSTLVPIGGEEALHALQAGTIDAMLLVGGVETPLIVEALRDPSIRLLSFNRADAYTRRFTYITKLTLPQGTIDLALDIPPQDVTLIGTKAMLAARPDLHPALVNLLVDAANEIHSSQGYFEMAGEFPSIAPVDLPVSEDAERHKRFGPSFIHRTLPFWLATIVERTVILLLPLVVILVPAINFFPQFLRWRVRSRVYRWYGELALLERDVQTRKSPLPVERWLKDLDRIEHAVEGIKTPTSFASEAYTLREHIGLVRRAVLAKAALAADP